MNFILVPFKNFKNAKSRLRKDLSDKETKKIVKLMLEDVLEQVSKSKLGDKKFLLTNDSEAIALGQKYGLEIILENKQINESTSVDNACTYLKKIGASAVLRLPGDVPAISHQDIDEIIHNGKKDNVSVLVPSESKLGTNAFFKCPPDVISSSFGENSFEKHMASFIGNDIKFKVMEIENVSIDIDSIEDLKKIKSSNKRSKTIDYIKETNL
jgi:2-phospho-L-lactate guanylyltransferase|tara:strand:+ start:110037 stop:110672 length:636 start_codon:yes stop_codon:yes gene_type:complete